MEKMIMLNGNTEPSNQLNTKNESPISLTPHSLNDINLALMKIEWIPIDEINTSSSHLRLNTDTTDLENSISTNGLLHPLTVSKNSNELLAGGRRFSALKKLCRTKVPVIYIQTESELKSELLSLDENLQRLNYEDVEFEEKLARRKRIYQDLYPETKSGIAGAVASNKVQGKSDANPESGVVLPSFVEDTAKKTGKSKSAVYQAIARDERSSPALKRAREEKLISTSQTDEVIKLSIEKQDEILPMIENKTVSETRAIVKAKLAPLSSESDLKSATFPTTKDLTRLKKTLTEAIEALKRYESLGKSLNTSDETNANIFESISELAMLLDQLIGETLADRGNANHA